MVTDKLARMVKNPSLYIGSMQQELFRLKTACEHHEVPFIWEKHLPKAA